MLIQRRPWLSGAQARRGCRAGSHSLRSPLPRPEQGHGHIPTCSLPLLRALHPSAFHTLLHTRVPLIALIILQTPALCFALGRRHVAEAGRAGQGWAGAGRARQGRQRCSHSMPGKAVAAAPAAPGAQQDGRSPSTAFPLLPSHGHTLPGIVPRCVHSKEEAGRREHWSPCKGRG